MAKLTLATADLAGMPITNGSWSVTPKPGGGSVSGATLLASLPEFGDLDADGNAVLSLPASRDGEWYRLEVETAQGRSVGHWGLVVVGDESAALAYERFLLERPDGGRTAVIERTESVGYVYIQHADITLNQSSPTPSADFWEVGLVNQEFAGGIQPGNDFIAVYQGALLFDVSATDTYEFRLRITHEVLGGDTFTTEHIYTTRITRNELATLPLNVFFSRSEIELGMYTPPIGTPFEITQAMLDAPSIIAIRLNVVRRTPQSSFSVQSAVITRGRATFYQLGSAPGLPGPEGPEGPQGVGIASAAYVDPNLTLTLTDGETEGPFDIKGDKGDPGDPGAGVPAGGTTGQSLVKKSDADRDTEWKTVQGGGGISTVSTDPTLIGDGSATNPLGVADPFTAADESKLDGIEAGAQVNPDAEDIINAISNDRQGDIDFSRVGTGDAADLRGLIRNNAVDDATLADEVKDLLLPTFPAAGQRDNKTPKFDGDTLDWEVDSGGVELSDATPQGPGPAVGGAGTKASRDDHVHRPANWGEVTAKPAQVTGIPAFPAAGSRAGKALEFVGDALTWKAGGSDSALELQLFKAMRFTNNTPQVMMLPFTPSPLPTSKTFDPSADNGFILVEIDGTDLAANAQRHDSMIVPARAFDDVEVQVTFSGVASAYLKLNARVPGHPNQRNLIVDVSPVGGLVPSGGASITARFYTLVGAAADGESPTLANITSALGLDPAAAANRGKLIRRHTSDDQGYDYIDVPASPWITSKTDALTKIRSDIPGFDFEVNAGRDSLDLVGPSTADPWPTPDDFSELDEVTADNVTLTDLVDVQTAPGTHKKLSAENLRDFVLEGDTPDGIRVVSHGARVAFARPTETNRWSIENRLVGNNQFDRRQIELAMLGVSRDKAQAFYDKVFAGGTAKVRLATDTSGAGANVTSASQPVEGIEAGASWFNMILTLDADVTIPNNVVNNVASSALPVEFSYLGADTAIQAETLDLSDFTIAAQGHAASVQIPASIKNKIGLPPEFGPVGGRDGQFLAFVGNDEDWRQPSDLTAAAALKGTDILMVDQGSGTRRTTLADIKTFVGPSAATEVLQTQGDKNWEIDGSRPNGQGVQIKVDASQPAKLLPGINDPTPFVTVTPDYGRYYWNYQKTEKFWQWTGHAFPRTAQPLLRIEVTFGWQQIPRDYALVLRLWSEQSSWGMENNRWDQFVGDSGGNNTNPGSDTAIFELNPNDTLAQGHWLALGCWLDFRGQGNPALSFGGEIRDIDVRFRIPTSHASADWPD